MPRLTPIFVRRRLTVSPFLAFVGSGGPIRGVLSTPILLIAMVARKEFSRYRKTHETVEQTQLKAA
ncbi:hypothetical protein [Bosea sp. PAMC 26642]|uniref:hypothetical protein n=1 Tax=Bosea sp. (strain PAMC 26642) TaxID=1792307 RepID=UPI000A8A95CB|nr:hypothetical protein [Bosea sp. PAMC 26642]